MDQKRRNLVLGIGSACLTYGCCSPGTFPKGRIGEGEPAAILQTFLRPRRSTWASKPARFCLDAHAHFFNASDVNVKGYLEGPIAHHMDKPLRQFLRGMAGVIDALTFIAPRADVEYHALKNRAMSVVLMDEKAQERALEGEVDAHLDTVANAVHAEMVKRKLGEKYLQLLQKDSSGKLPLSTQSRRQFSPEMVREAMDPVSRRKLRIASAGGRGGVDANGLLEFSFHMLSSRWMNVFTYKKFFTEEEDSVGMDGAFASLVDFDRWLDCPSRSARADQVRVHSMLSLVSGGYVLPLVAYNPWTDIVDSDGSIELVRSAIRDYGFVGVKIYPPVGYFPAGNSQLHVPTNKPRPDLKDLDAKLTALFDFCMSENVPVMAHTGESMGRDDASDELGGPKGWIALLKNFKDRGAPIVNLGHFGGDEPKQFPDGGGSTDSKWPQELAQMMASTPNAERIFGDLGYWSALRDCSASGECDARTRLKEALAKYPALADRLMFGTDWLMLSKESDWQEYPRTIVRALARDIPVERLMYQNAMDCFGLGPEGPNRARVAQRLKQVTGRVPNWLA